VWAPEEGGRLHKAFDAGIDVTELATRHWHLTRAIKPCPVNRGRIEP
jgi:hypothetical protein